MSLLPQQCLTIVIVLLGVYTGNTETSCDFDRSCLPIYNNLKGIYEEVDINDWNTICGLSQDLKDCMKKNMRRCRGDLNFHFFEKLVKDLNANIGVGRHCSGGLPKDHPTDSGRGVPSVRTTHHPCRHGCNTRPSRPDRCAPKIPLDSPTVGCALFGLTNLKSFSETLNFTDINYCSLAGAWNLVDTPEFAVQITNKGGLSPLPRDITATTLVTVIIKNSHCSERKTYQATFDEIPGMFSDGHTKAGSVYIQIIRESEHVKIHLPFILTTIDVIKVIDKLPIPSLSVAIKMPQTSVESLMSEPKKIRGLPLCFFGCPRAAANRQRSTEAPAQITGRSTSGVGTYYKSNCPAFPPPTVEPTLDPNSPSPSSASLPSSGEEPQSDSVQPQDFSASLSAEFLDEDSDEEEEEEEEENSSPEHSKIPLASDVIAGNTRRRHRASSHESSGATTPVICASLNSVHSVLAGSTIVGHRLRLPGEDNFSSSPDSGGSGEDFAHVMNSALTSQSAPMSRYHSAFVYLVVILIFICR